MFSVCLLTGGGGLGIVLSGIVLGIVGGGYLSGANSVGEGWGNLFSAKSRGLGGGYLSSVKSVGGGVPVQCQVLGGAVP